MALQFTFFPCRSGNRLAWLRRLALLGGLSVAWVAQAQQPMEVKYFSKGNSAGLQPYQKELLLLALNKTRDEFGPYTISYYDEPLSSARAKAETERGDLINVHYSSEWTGLYADPSRVVMLEHPILQGMLGMRSLLVREDMEDSFSAAETYQDFTRLSAGQGSSWPDVDILRYNQVEVVQSELFSNLLPMLAAKRFDYLPLSILEAPSVLEENNTPDAITIAKDRALFYPLPIFICVTRTEEKLAKRIDTGIKKAMRDGSLNKLFRKHFQPSIDTLREDNLKVFLLHNPFLSEEDNQRIIGQFIERNGDFITLIRP